MMKCAPETLSFIRLTFLHWYQPFVFTLLFLVPFFEMEMCLTDRPERFQTQYRLLHGVLTNKCREISTFLNTGAEQAVK